MNYLKHYLAICLMLVSFPAYPEQPKTGHVQIVEDFITAFNAHDSEAMSKLVTDDVQWLYVNADTILVETKGKSALISAMNNYFKMCSTCRSALTEVIATQDRVSAIEVASWQSKSGSKEQRSLAVYEFSEGLIKRVYYFPAEK